MSLRWYTLVIDCHDNTAQARCWADALGWVSYESDSEVAVIPSWADRRAYSRPVLESAHADPRPRQLRRADHQCRRERPRAEPPPMTLPDLDTLLGGLRVVSIPMRVRFRGVGHREAALIHGPAGWGEFSPFLEYATPEASRWLAAAIEAAWDGWPEPLRDRVPVNATVPAVAAGDVEAVLARYDGCTTAKVKVAERGQSLDEDVCRVAAVRDAMGPHGRVRVDANGGWDVDQAVAALGALTAYGLEYAEQPCASVEELTELRILLARKGIDVLVAADESIRKTEDPLRVAREGAADIIVVKVAPLGGVRAALAIARECGLPTVVSSALDTSVGVAAGAALAAALPDLPYACGLGTVELLDGDVSEPSRVPVGGSIAIGPAVVSEGLVDALAAPAGRALWWRDRVAACHATLTALADRGSAPARGWPDTR